MTAGRINRGVLCVYRSQQLRAQNDELAITKLENLFFVSDRLGETHGN